MPPLIRLLPQGRRLRIIAGPLGCLTLAVFALWVTGALWLGKDVTVTVDGRTIGLRTAAVSVAAVLEEAGVSLGARDGVEPPCGAAPTDGMTIAVRRAVHVTVTIDGHDLAVVTAARSVGEVFQEGRLRISRYDRLDPPADTPVTRDMAVTVTRVVQSYQHREDEIPFETVRRDDMTMDIGQTTVVEAGVTGLLRRLLFVTYEDGREVSEEELSRTVVREPVIEVIHVGTAGTIVRGGESIRFLKVLDVRATAYEPSSISCGVWADGLTALGLRATKGIIAVDPSVIPLWTRVYVDGYGFAVAGDVGSAIKGKRIDVCFDTYAEAMNWGVRRVRVYILKLPGT